MGLILQAANAQLLGNNLLTASFLNISNSSMKERQLLYGQKSIWVSECHSLAKVFEKNQACILCLNGFSNLLNICNAFYFLKELKIQKNSNRPSVNSVEKSYFISTNLLVQ